MQMYLTWAPSTWAIVSGCPPLFCLILLYMYRITDHWLLFLVRRKFPLTHGLDITRDTLEMPKCEIFDLFDFNDFYVIKSLQVGDLRAEIKN